MKLNKKITIKLCSQAYVNLSYIVVTQLSLLFFQAKDKEVEKTVERNM